MEERTLLKPLPETTEEDSQKNALNLDTDKHPLYAAEAAQGSFVRVREGKHWTLAMLFPNPSAVPQSSPSHTWRSEISAISKMFHRPIHFPAVFFLFETLAFVVFLLASG